MPIPVTCTGCAARLNVKDQLEGKRIRCPKCKTVITVSRPQPQPEEKPTDRPASAITAVPPDDDAPALVKLVGPAPRRNPDRSAAIRKPAGMSKVVKVILFSLGGVFGTLCLTCAGFGIWFEASKKNALAYNDRMTNAQGRVVRARVALIARIDDCRFKPAAADGAEMGMIRKDYEDLRTAIDAVHSEMPNWSAPWGARDLHQRCQEYLAHEQAALPKFAKAMAIVGDVNLSEQQRQDDAGRILDEVETSEKGPFAALDKAQLDFASFYQLRLAPAPVILPPPRVIQMQP